jgi:hypothetical protein
MKCVVLTWQHTIAASVFRLGISSLTRNLEGHRVKKLSCGSNIIYTLHQSHMKGTVKKLTVTQKLSSRTATLLSFMRLSILNNKFYGS